MQSYLTRSLAKGGFSFASAVSGAAAFTLLRDTHAWKRNPWETVIGLLLLCICLVSFLALLRLRTPALFYSLAATVKRLGQRLRRGLE